MNIERLRYMQQLIMDAIIAAEPLEVPEWRFDGKEITRPEEVAAYCNISVNEAQARMTQKDIHAGSGESATTHGIGTRTTRKLIRQRANALAYVQRRRRRHKRRSEQ